LKIIPTACCYFRAKLQNVLGRQEGEKRTEFVVVCFIVILYTH